jgi:hypothetical protein
MYKLVMESEDEEGVKVRGVFYSRERGHVKNVRDLMCLEFLRELSRDSFYCTSEVNVPGICIMLSPAGEYLEERGRWKLDKRYDYRFEIDIYEVRQCGCEEVVSLRDIEDGRLFEMYRESEGKGYKDGVPKLEVEEYEEECGGGYDDLLYYTRKCEYVSEPDFRVIPYEVYLTSSGCVEECVERMEVE